MTADAVTYVGAVGFAQGGAGGGARWPDTHEKAGAGGGPAGVGGGVSTAGRWECAPAVACEEEGRARGCLEGVAAGPGGRLALAPCSAAGGLCVRGSAAAWPVKMLRHGVSRWGSHEASRLSLLALKAGPNGEGAPLCMPAPVCGWGDASALGPAPRRLRAYCAFKASMAASHCAESGSLPLLPLRRQAARCWGGGGGARACCTGGCWRHAWAEEARTVREPTSGALPPAASGNLREDCVLSPPAQAEAPWPGSASVKALLLARDRCLAEGGAWLGTRLALLVRSGVVALLKFEGVGRSWKYGGRGVSACSGKAGIGDEEEMGARGSARTRT